MITIKEIAEMTGVSPTTVQNVIHGRTGKVSRANVERIRAVLEETRYVPRLAHETMTKGHTKIIGVIIYTTRQFEETTAADPFYGQLIGYLEDEIRRAGYYMMLYISPDIEEIFRTVSSWSMIGVVAVSFSANAFAKLTAMVTDCPMVGIDTGRKRGPVRHNVGLDDLDGGYEMTRYLLSRGYRTILYVSERERQADDLRFQGYRQALEEAGIPYRERFFVELDRVDEVRNRNCLAHIESFRGEAAAIFCNSDHLALKVMNHLLSVGCRVPDEIGIAGFDNSVYAGIVWPSLTTMHQSVSGKAEEAVRMLLHLLAEPGWEGAEVLLKSRVVPRHSTR